MNVLQILPELNAGGVERTTVEIAEALIAKGHKAHIASAGGRMTHDLEALGACLHTLALNTKNPLQTIPLTKALIKLIKTHKIDIVHARSRAPAWPAYRAACRTQTPFVTTYHGIYNAKTHLKRKYNAVMAKGDVVIANSAYTQTHILKEHKIDPDKIVIIPRGVDMNIFDPAKIDPKKIKTFRDEWGVGASEKVVLLPGRLTRWKGQSVAISALAHFPKDTVLVLMGDAQGRTHFESELQALAAQNHVADRIKRVQHCTDMPTALMTANIVLSASTDPEAFGRISAEAQAMGRPIVATAHGGTLETVIDQMTGLYITPNDSLSLARGVTQALNWPDYDGAFARQRISEKFSKAKLQDKTLKVYERLLAAQA